MNLNQSFMPFKIWNVTSKKLESEQFYETYTLISLAKDFLDEHGFYIHQKSDDRRYITTEIWYKD